jgi:hypothetical protein
MAKQSNGSKKQQLEQLAREVVQQTLQGRRSPRKDQALLNVLSRTSSSRRLKDSTSGGATHREDLIRAIMADNPNLTYERAALEIDLFG